MAWSDMIRNGIEQGLYQLNQLKSFVEETDGNPPVLDVLIATGDINEEEKQELFELISQEIQKLEG